ncbi:MAG TPA: SDR family oxidoreductase [Acidimicrobiales bacterium]
MDLGIAGRVALVTASSKGLGRASAAALREEGVDVVICARGREAVEETTTALGGPEHVLGLVEDVTDPEAPGRLVAAAVERWGRLDIVVPNAGGPPPGRALEVTDDQIEAAVNANLITSVRLIREAVPHMAKAGWGRVCCITSYSVKQPIPTLALSNLARTGLWAWAKTAAQDLAGTGITVNLACPGAHATDRMKQLGGSGPMGDPAQFGRVVAFLCSEPAAFVNGAALQVDGGATTGLL